MIPLSESAPPIPRHRTAMSRPELSRPLRLALDAGLIEKSSCVFDYGCGRGDDLRGLEASGIRCFGWILCSVLQDNGRQPRSSI